MLNFLLIAVPVFTALCFSAWVRIEVAREVARSAGDPAAYQHFYWVEIPFYPWPLAAYFLVPNGILLLAYARSGSRTRDAVADD